MRDARAELADRWLGRIVERVSAHDPRRPSAAELRDSMPLFIGGIADHLEQPADEIAADVPVISHAMELGDVRFRQGFDVHEILKEYEILGGVLFSFLRQVADEEPAPCSQGHLMECGHRVFHGVMMLQQATAALYLRRLEERSREREERLRRFNRMVSHELKERVGAIVGAQAMLREEWLDTEQRRGFGEMIGHEAEGIQRLLDDLTTLSRVEAEARHHRHVMLPQAVAEAVRQLRRAAVARGVQVRVARRLPRVEVHAAAVELCLINYLSNAIKYSDPRRARRLVTVTAQLRVEGAGAGELVVAVRDNGLGVPAAQREHLFERFFRVHDERAGRVEGTGLGLSIVRETVESLGGRAWAEFGRTGSTFAFTLPIRRLTDTASANERRPRAARADRAEAHAPHMSHAPRPSAHSDVEAR